MPALTKLLEQSRLLHLALEEFEGVLQAIVLIETNFYHAALPLGWIREASERGSGTCPGPPGLLGMPS
jgi:hypothetical protein